MNKRLHFFETEPIIAAVKTEEQLVRALSSECNVIFFLFGNICIPKSYQSCFATFTRKDGVRSLRYGARYHNSLPLLLRS